jgi:hypothetical protein
MAPITKVLRAKKGALAHFGNWYISKDGTRTNYGSQIQTRETILMSHACRKSLQELTTASPIADAQGKKNR